MANRNDIFNASASPAFTAPGLADPQAGLQWHLARLGGIADVWADYTGRGVNVGVYDSGVQYSHYDLSPNYDASLHVVLDGKTYDGDHRPNSGPHGTAVAGIIAAARNGVGTVGVAYDAKVTGVNIFDRYSGGGLNPGIFVNEGGDLFFRAMEQAHRFDVVNHSWGNSQSGFDSDYSRGVAGTFSYRQSEALRYAAERGRDGLGTVSVLATGNSDVDAQGDAWNSDRHAVSVAAYRQTDSYASSYSSRGAHLLVSAPSSDEVFLGGSGVVATDLLGRDGYNLQGDLGGSHDYTDDFGGTSAAAPVVSGVVALMLDANEGLGWRDVKNILAASAFAPRGVDAAPGGFDLPQGFQLRLNESRFKLAGQDAKWNGGAMHYSTDYGFGGVDAHAAVRMAEVWSLFGEAKTSRNEQAIATDVLDVNLSSTGDLWGGDAHTDFVGEPVRYSFTVDADIDLEHVDLTLTYSTGRTWGDQTFYYGTNALQLKLTAPDGSQAFVDTADADASSNEPLHSFTFGFSGFRGVKSAGTWTFEFLEPYADITTTVKTLQLNGWGSAISANDVHSFTDEYFDMVAFDTATDRRALSDTNGGADWINAAAVTADVALSLVEGATTRFDGQDAFTIARGSLIENAVTGDGNDRLIGNALDNRLYGMRGDDWLNGGAGNDTLFGGQGRDVFAFDTAGVSGNDRILDWSAGDRIATSKMLRGADQNGVLTLGSSALLLLDGISRGDTAELAGQGGATLQALGRSDGYWWYGFLTEGDEDFVDGRVTELALGQTAAPAIGAQASSAAADGTFKATSAADSAFFLYDVMGDGMASGAQLYA